MHARNTNAATNVSYAYFKINDMTTKKTLALDLVGDSPNLRYDKERAGDSLFETDTNKLNLMKRDEVSDPYVITQVNGNKYADKYNFT